MIYIYSNNKQSPGIQVIVNHLNVFLNNRGVSCKVTSNLESVTDKDMVIPYGPKCAYEIVKNGNYKTDLALLVDYYSWGCLNKIKFYLKNGLINYKDFWYSIVSYLRYSRKEASLLKKYRNIMLVSDEDVKNIKKINSDVSYICVPNGVDVTNRKIVKHEREDKITMGIIAHWSFISVDETRWFIEKYFDKLVEKYPNLRLKIAGKGDATTARYYFCRHKNVDFIGEVDSLDDFFNSLDIYVATIPKGCGILNKVLDAFSYKVYTIGNSASFSAFRTLKNGYVICESFEDYVNAIELYKNENKKIDEMTQESYDYVKDNHNWEKNYELLAKLIINLYSENYK